MGLTSSSRESWRQINRIGIVQNSLSVLLSLAQKHPHRLRSASAFEQRAICSPYITIIQIVEILFLFLLLG